MAERALLHHEDLLAALQGTLRCPGGAATGADDEQLCVEDLPVWVAGGCGGGLVGMRLCDDTEGAGPARFAMAATAPAPASPLAAPFRNSLRGSAMFGIVCASLVSSSPSPWELATRTGVRRRAPASWLA